MLLAVCVKEMLLLGTQGPIPEVTPCLCAKFLSLILVFCPEQDRWQEPTLGWSSTTLRRAS